MAELADLLAKLPDNQSGEISAQDMRDIVTQLWLRSTAYGGMVVNTGELRSGPSGWTAVRDAVGVYTVTHNLNIPADLYSVVVTEMQLETQAPVVAAILATTATSFTYALATPDGVPTSRTASFVMAINR